MLAILIVFDGARAAPRSSASSSGATLVTVVGFLDGPRLASITRSSFLPGMPLAAVILLVSGIHATGLQPGLSRQALGYWLDAALTIVWGRRHHRLL